MIVKRKKQHSLILARRGDAQYFVDVSATVSLCRPCNSVLVSTLFFFFIIVSQQLGLKLLFCKMIYVQQENGIAQL